MALWLFCLVKYERIKFLVIALKNAVEVYAWAPKPYHKFMAFKVSLPFPASWITYARSVNQTSIQVDYPLTLTFVPHPLPFKTSLLQTCHTGLCLST